MSDYFVEVERGLRAATARRANRPWLWRLTRRPVGLRLVLIVLAVVLATTTITLAATGVILVGSPVGLSSRPSATVGEGIPIAGASRLLPLRAPDPAGGLPWGMRVVHTTRGLICVQIGRVQNGALGQLGVDGAFGNDGRFHPLPPDALPDVVRHSFEGFENCAEPSAVYAGDVVGLQLSAASNPRAGVGPAADRREISFGLLGAHALSITYRSGSQTHSQPVLAKLGAYLIVQRYTSGRPLGSVSETDGSEQRYPYGFPTAPNGALSAITYRYGGRVCTDTGRSQVIRACGLSEAPPPRQAPLPSVHVPLKVHLQIHGHVVTDATISFRAPYPVTSANQAYLASGSTCRGYGGGSSNADVASGKTVEISVGYLLLGSCKRSVTVRVEYARSFNGPVTPSILGTVTIRMPPGTHALPLPHPPPVAHRG